MMLALYSLGLLAVLVAGLPYWLFRMMTSGKYREGIFERLGRVPGRLKHEPTHQTLWVHAVSVGEVTAALPVVEALKRLKEPQSRDSRYRVLLSTTTRAGQQLARERLGPAEVFYFPIDFVWVIRRYLKLLQPSLMILVESELWPNLLRECRRAAIPAVVMNGRISDRSLPRYLRLRRLWKPVLENLSLVLAQSSENAKRFVAIGVPAGRVAVTGNLKFDAKVAKPAVITEQIRRHLPRGMRVLVCGSTVEGEEELLLRVFVEIQETEPNILMILAPRHPERFDAVAELMKSLAKRSVRRSQWILNPQDLVPGTAMLLDSIGELSSVYSLGSIAFVGKSLRGSGGHNPLEPAQFGVPIVMGTRYENFTAVVDWLIRSDAIKLVTDVTLTEVILSLLRDKDSADQLGLRALEAFDSQAGSTQKTVSALLEVMRKNSVGEGYDPGASAAHLGRPK